jgi:predicted outer membrane protein
MSASLKLRVGVVAAGLSCLVIGYAWAQQQQDDLPRASEQPRTGQIDRPATQEGQQYTAQFRGTQATAGQNQQVQQFLAACLLAKNQAEVELGQLAQQQAQNPEVKQFAQKTVQDHRQIVQQLQPLAGTQKTAARTERSTSLDASSQIDAERQASDTTLLPGSPGATQPARPGTTTEDLSRDASQALTADRPAGQSAALNQLAEIERQITERHKEAVREELQQKQGAEFDKCYVGGQVAGHMHMLAALEVIQEKGPDQLRQIAQQAQPTVQQHLDHAKQLMKQLEGAGATTNRAERQPTRTQR